MPPSALVCFCLVVAGRAIAAVQLDSGGRLRLCLEAFVAATLRFRPLLLR